MVLIWLAADWIGKHPDKARLSDLIQTYQQLNEDRDAEPMTAILAAVAAIKDRKAVPFLKEVLTGTKKKMIADQIVKILTDWDVRIETLPQVRDSLFIPPEIVPENAQIVVRITTTKGDIDVRLRPDAALLTVSNFMYLMHRGFYQNILFHRVVSDFVIQAGDPRGDGWGGPGYSIPCEYNRLPFMRGTMGMATAGKDTGGSQFFICHSEQPHLDRRYTVFGQVIKGLDVVDKIEIDDQITQITQLN
jgi:cyclophilin family peptidyl-prolyl cis-trans isomerase